MKNETVVELVVGGREAWYAYILVHCDIIIIDHGRFLLRCQQTNLLVTYYDFSYEIISSSIINSGW